jgi:hypothetical protein
MRMSLRLSVRDFGQITLGDVDQNDMNQELPSPDSPPCTHHVDTVKPNLQSDSCTEPIVDSWSDNNIITTCKHSSKLGSGVACLWLPIVAVGAIGLSVGVRHVGQIK